MGRTHRDGDRGATLVEFAFVSVLLFTLLFGIIGFGVLLSFKQTTTQAANEGARAAAVTQDDPATAYDDRYEAAETSVNSFSAWGRDCNSPGMECAIDIHDCGGLVTQQTSATPDCVTVRLTYDYGDHPILPPFPLIAAFMPETVEQTATAQLTFP